MEIAALLRPEWPAHPRVQALVTTRAAGDARTFGESDFLKRLVPRPPVWLRQVHGARVIDADAPPALAEADAAVARRAGTVCAVRMADCLPVLLADAEGSVVGAAHAGWRGLAAGVIEATVAAMKAPPERLIAWLGPAIGPQSYEVGEDVRAAFADCEGALRAARPGHWLLDLYAVARQRLGRAGVLAVHGGGFCTYRDRERFFSYRRDRSAERMAALIWLA
ncbi:MAG TPA: peptidoglycan editing factor PgeF [Burkholderiales bacterium]